jgi:hypothetical protein
MSNRGLSTPRGMLAGPALGLLPALLGCLGARLVAAPPAQAGTGQFHGVNWAEFSGGT